MLVALNPRKNGSALIYSSKITGMGWFFIYLECSQWRSTLTSRVLFQTFSQAFVKRYSRSLEVAVALELHQPLVRLVQVSRLRRKQSQQRLLQALQESSDVD